MEVVKPHYFEGRRGHKPVGIEGMPRMYFLQLWFNLSDKGVMMRGSSIVGATIIQALSSTKNASALTVLFALANVVTRPRTERICPRALARA